MADKNPKAKPLDLAQTDSRHMMKRIWADYVWPHRWSVYKAVVFMIVLAFASGALAWLIGPTVKEIFQDKDPYLVKVLPFGVFSLIMVQSFASYMQAKHMNFVGQRIVADVQTDIFRNLMYADQARLNQSHSGNFVSSFLYDATLLREAVTQGITGLGKNLLTLIAYIGVMFYADWQLAIIAIIVAPFMVRVSQSLSKRMRKATYQGMDETETLTRLVSESLSGARTVKAYGQEETEIGRVSNSIETRLSHLMAVVKARIQAAPLNEAISALSISAALGYAGYRSLNGTLELDAFISFLAAMMLAYQPGKSLSQIHVVLNEGLTAAKRIFSILDITPAIKDPEDGKELALKDGAISLNTVMFRYNEEAVALNGLDLQIPAGQTIALVGPSGAGKSTVFNLIPRFYDVTSGGVTIDGQDVRNVTIASLRKAIAIVTQEPFLFDDTIRANIAYGRPGASDAEVEQAAAQAAAHDFIMEQPDGYDTFVGEQGLRLSGGQRQRIAIARAMLADAPILLLDEATSALDNESEQKVQQALRTLMKGRTTIVIAHRLSTIMDADRIYVLDQGKVIEQGTHSELLAKAGLYARLYRTQFTDADTPLTMPSLSAAGE